MREKQDTAPAMTERLNAELRKILADDWGAIVKVENIRGKRDEVFKE